jgi:hypothetical protein
MPPQQPIQTNMMPKKSKNPIVIGMLAVLIILAVYIAFFKKGNTEVDTKDTASLSGQTDIGHSDLISFSIGSNTIVSGKMHSTGIIQGGYFFEGNLPVNILDVNKNPTSYGPGHGTATTDWMTAGPVSFSIDFDFSAVPNGSYYIRIMQDDPSGGESGKPIKSVLIPIIVNNSPAPVIANTNVTVYHNHGFTMELPSGYIPNEMESEAGPATSITLPNASHLSYVVDATWWEQYSLSSYQYVKNEKIGVTTFKVYTHGNQTFYWYKQGNVGYEFFGDKNLLKTFKFVGWN